VTTLRSKWLVDTTIGTEWTVRHLMRDGVPFPDEETPFHYPGFRSADVGGA
jgi:hypothetical protein